MAQFIKTNWFNVVSICIILFTAVRSYTWNEANVKTLQSSVVEVKGAVTDLTGLVATLSKSVSDLDKAQAVDKERLNNLNASVSELRERKQNIWASR